VLGVKCQARRNEESESKDTGKWTDGFSQSVFKKRALAPCWVFSFLFLAEGNLYDRFSLPHHASCIMRNENGKARKLWKKHRGIVHKNIT